jgi:hypothetical protein
MVFEYLYKKILLFLYICTVPALLSPRGVEGGLPSGNSQGLSQPPFPLYVFRTLSPYSLGPTLSVIIIIAGGRAKKRESRFVLLFSTKLLFNFEYTHENLFIVVFSSGIGQYFSAISSRRMQEKSAHNASASAKRGLLNRIL